MSYKIEKREKLFSYYSYYESESIAQIEKSLIYFSIGFSSIGCTENVYNHGVGPKF